LADKPPVNGVTVGLLIFQMDL